MTGAVRSLAVLLTAVFLASCGTTMPYAGRVPMSANSFTTRDGAMGGLVPEGWFSSMDDTLAPALSAWLSRNDFRAAITLRKISADPVTTKRIADQGLKVLLLAEAGLLGSESVTPVSEPREFDIRGVKYCAAEFQTDQGPTRLVVFGIKGNFYECRAAKTRGEWSMDDFRDLFTVQQSVLSTLQQ